MTQEDGIKRKHEEREQEWKKKNEIGLKKKETGLKI